MRKRWPELTNYEYLGFKGEVSNFIRQKFGPEAAFYYRKQFECKLLRSVAEKITEPCIIDVGGGMPVILEDECKKLDEQARAFDEKLYLEHFDLSVLNFEHIQESLKPFKNVVELKLPANYKDTMEKASHNSRFNDEYIESGCFEKLATQTVEVGGLVEGGKVDEKKLDNKVKEIEKKCQIDVSVR